MLKYNPKPPTFRFLVFKSMWLDLSVGNNNFISYNLFIANLCMVYSFICFSLCPILSPLLLYPYVKICLFCRYIYGTYSIKPLFASTCVSEHTYDDILRQKGKKKKKEDGAKNREILWPNIFGKYWILCSFLELHNTHEPITDFERSKLW